MIIDKGQRENDVIKSGTETGNILEETCITLHQQPHHGNGPNDSFSCSRITVQDTMEN